MVRQVKKSFGGGKTKKVHKTQTRKVGPNGRPWGQLSSLRYVLCEAMLYIAYVQWGMACSGRQVSMDPQNDTPSTVPETLVISQHTQ